ncbi:Ff.00g004080.m01.CDS01 [Fusarium sp. VM40]|nr:Ff.00g004080.m01.CDS01 [Fusarium sp. VM40]
MKASMIIALPALALAAASPVQVEERQLPSVPGLPELPGLPTLDLTCISQITGLTACAPSIANLQNPAALSPALLTQLITCPLQIIGRVIDCII